MYKDLLVSAIAIPSVSTDKKFRSSMTEMADWYQALFAEHGFTSEQVVGYGNPIVQARYVQDESLPTCMIYGHYDVQPAEMKDGWKSEPFKLMEQDGRMFGRGTADNKGQTMIHIATVFEAIKNKSLKYNILFVLEGDEETAAGDIGAYLEEKKDVIGADFVLISDGEYVKNPLLEIGFRGCGNITLRVDTLSTDVHSGSYGGLVANASQEISSIISSFYNDKYELRIDGMESSNISLSAAQWAAVKKSCMNEETLTSSTGAKAQLPVKAHPACTLGLEPTIQVTGLVSGYTGEGYRNSVPSWAEAKINIRFAPDSDTSSDIVALKKHIEQNTSPYCTVTLTEDAAEEGALLSVENQYAENAIKILEHVFEEEVYLSYCGGTLPIANYIDTILKIPQLHVPLANHDCAMHAPNENMTLDAIEKGLKFSKQFFTGK